MILRFSTNTKVSMRARPTSKNKENIEVLRNIEEKAICIMKSYLLDHEADIAYGENDFGDLFEVFYYYFDRDPRKESMNEV